MDVSSRESAPAKLTEGTKLRLKIASCGDAQRLLIDRFPQRTVKWMSLPVLADPFWGRLPWLLKRRGGKHSKHRKVSRLRECARVRFGVGYGSVTR
jgi:hypothetical protein